MPTSPADQIRRLSRADYRQVDAIARCLRSGWGVYFSRDSGRPLEWTTPLLSTDSDGRRFYNGYALQLAEELVKADIPLYTDAERREYAIRAFRAGDIGCARAWIRGSRWLGDTNRLNLPR